MMHFNVRSRWAYDMRFWQDGDFHINFYENNFSHNSDMVDIKQFGWGAVDVITTLTWKWRAGLYIDMRVDGGASDWHECGEWGLYIDMRVEGGALHWHESGGWGFTLTWEWRVGIYIDMRVEGGALHWNEWKVGLYIDMRVDGGALHWHGSWGWGFTLKCI